MIPGIPLKEGFDQPVQTKTLQIPGQDLQSNLKLEALGGYVQIYANKEQISPSSSLDPSVLHFLQNGREQDPTLVTWQKGLWSDSPWYSSGPLYKAVPFLSPQERRGPLEHLAVTDHSCPGSIPSSPAAVCMDSYDG